MLALLQRVNSAEVEIDKQITAKINKGILAFVCFEKEDSLANAKKMFDKIVKYRLFSDDEDRLNLNVSQVEGSILIVSQFTLAANTKQGTRPSFDPAMPPKQALALYNEFIEYAKANYPRIETGEFAADMKVRLENDGPVTFMLKM